LQNEERERWAMIRTFQFLFNSCILQHGHYLGDLGGAIPLQSGYVAIVFMILSQLIGFIAMVSANNNPNCTPEILFINSSNRYIHLNPYIYTCIYNRRKFRIKLPTIWTDEKREEKD
jgi:hypothetical protein